MSIAKRRDGRFIVKYKDADGNWKQRTFRATQEAEARRFDAECQYDEIDNTRLTVAEAVIAYMKNVPHVKITKYAFRRVLKVIAPHLGNRFVDTLNRRDLESVRDFCRSQGDKNSTINLYTGKLQAAFRWCADQDMIERNPWENYKCLPSRTVHRDGTLEDFRLIYAELPDWMKWACRTSLALCLRPGPSELFSLRWSAFDWRQRLCNVYMPKVKETKTVFPPAAYLEEARERYEDDMKKGCDIVCRSFRGRQICMGSFVYAWKKACTDSGVKMPPYAMRHIAASEMLAGGADLAAVAAQLGHRSISTTTSYYTHAIKSAQQRAANALPLVSNGAGF